MEPAVTWLDLTASDRDRMRRVLDLFKEQDTLDELGLGSLRDALANALFPGTTSVQTRLRYVLFIPWIYQQLEAKGVDPANVGKEARKAELGLIQPLVGSSDTQGVIGARSRWNLQRLPSAVYWSALVRWGLFNHPKSQGWYHARFGTWSRAVAAPRADDPGVVALVKRNWHPRLPPPPSSFPREASFALRDAEAEFLREMITCRCPGTLLAHLANATAPPSAATPWDEPSVADLPAELAQTLELARRFSLHVEGAPLLYNLMLTEARLRLERRAEDEERLAVYREELGLWAEAELAEAAFDPVELWSFCARVGRSVPAGQRRFVEGWAVALRGLDAPRAVADPQLRALVEHRERSLKGGRSRFKSAKRLDAWSGSSGLGRMDFRWGRVRQFMQDLHGGSSHAGS